MAAKLARIESRGTVPVERRRKPRTPVRRQVTLRSSNGDSASVALNDVSIHGCAVRIAEAWARPGVFVTLRLGSSDPIQGIIRWVRDGAAGLEFLWPVPESHADWRALTENPSF